MIIKGRVFKFGDNVNTDEIIPARYLNTSDPAELARHCMEDIDPDFPQKVKKGDIILAGRNFGCGSSREHAPIAIKTCGVPLVVAESFARIFFRNAFNIGLPIVRSENVGEYVNNGDELEVDLIGGTLKNYTSNRSFTFEKFPGFMQDLIQAGGLMAYSKTLVKS